MIIRLTFFPGMAWLPMADRITALRFANGIQQTNTFNRDYLLTRIRLRHGPTALYDRSLARDRRDRVNITAITDRLAGANTQTFAYTATNRLRQANGPWGRMTVHYDRLGNRVRVVSAPPAGTPRTTESYRYPSRSNRLERIQSHANARATTTRAFSYLPSGAVATDTRLGVAHSYTYTALGQLKTVRFEGNLRASYTYNGRRQLAIRVLSNLGASVNGTVHTIHDIFGNVIAEADGAGRTGREYLWIPGAGVAGVALPIAVVDGVATATPLLHYVHADHLSRPVLITNAARAVMWRAEWLPWGAPHAVTGTLAQPARFPGQWFQLEAGLHYNWHRHYDPTLGRYLQPDPLGVVPGPNVFAYANNDPLSQVDPKGEHPILILCMRAPRLCAEILRCIKNPKACGRRYCRFGRIIYTKICRVPGCRPGDHLATLQFKRMAAEACLLLRIQVSTFCYGGPDQGHLIQIEKARKKLKDCKQRCYIKSQ